MLLPSHHLRHPSVSIVQSQATKFEFKKKNSSEDTEKKSLGDEYFRRKRNLHRVLTNEYVCVCVCSNTCSIQDFTFSYWIPTMKWKKIRMTTAQKRREHHFMPFHWFVKFKTRHLWEYRSGMMIAVVIVVSRLRKMDDRWLIASWTRFWCVCHRVTIHSCCY